MAAGSRSCISAVPAALSGALALPTPVAVLGVLALPVAVSGALASPAPVAVLGVLALPVAVSGALAVRAAAGPALTGPVGAVAS
jgi:hypothetical protein